MFKLLKKYKTSILAAIAEIVIVFIGISISLYIDDWKEEADNNKLETVYLKELYSELTEDFKVLQNLKNDIERKENLMDLILGCMHYPDSIQLDQITFKQSIGKILRLQNFISKDYTFKDLTSTGNMKLISDTKLRKLIYQYYNYVAQAEKAVEINNNLVSDLFNEHVFPTFPFREIMDYNWIIKNDKLTALDLEFLKNPSSHKYIVLENIILLRVSLNHTEANFYKRGFQTCHELRTTIGEKLGIPDNKEYIDKFSKSSKSAKDLYLEFKETYPDFLLIEMSLNSFAYNFLESNDKKKAIELFQLNMELYPDSYNVYDSMGDGYYALGELNKAIFYYEKAYLMNPGVIETKQKIFEVKKKLNQK